MADRLEAFNAGILLAEVQSDKRKPDSRLTAFFGRPDLRKAEEDFKEFTDYTLHFIFSALPDTHVAIRAWFNAGLQIEQRLRRVAWLKQDALRWAIGYTRFREALEELGLETDKFQVVDKVEMLCRMFQIADESDHWVSEIVSRLRDEAKLQDRDSPLARPWLANHGASNQAGIVAESGRDTERSWDVFVSYASEDKDDVAKPLAEALRSQGVLVWFDEFSLRIGDSLNRSINRGLATSRFGVVIISQYFLQKEWPQRELDGMTALEVDGRKVILPVWHGVSRNIVAKYSPILADRLAANSADGIDKVVEKLLMAME